MKYPIYLPDLGETETSFVTDAVKGGWISSLGPYVSRFEDDFAKIVGVQHAVAVMNGTVALHLALHCLGLKKGDEVIVPDLSFIATVNAVLMTGATPIFVDIEECNLCIDVNAVRSAITEKTKAIMPVHLYGHPSNMEEIMSIASEYNLLVIEDCAEAHGAKVNGKVVGSFGHCGCFSFYGNKIITTGEGGMITTNSSEVRDRLRFLRDHGMSPSKRYWHTELAYNYRMTNLQAAVGCAQLERFNEIIHRKQKIRDRYYFNLSSNDSIILTEASSWAEDVFWLMTVQIKDFTELDRDKLILELGQNGVDSRPFFYPMSSMPYLNSSIKNNISILVSQRGLNLPSSSSLSFDEIDEICYILQNSIINIKH